MEIYKTVDREGLCWFSIDNNEPIFGISELVPFIQDLCVRMAKEQLKQIIFEIKDYSFMRNPYAYNKWFRLCDYDAWPETGSIMTAQKDSGKWIVLDSPDGIFNKYDYIDGFDCGLARVFRKHRVSVSGIYNIKNAASGWGIVDLDGNEILPLSPNYKVWRFYGKALQGTTIQIGNGNENDNLFWFDFASRLLIPKKHVSSEDMYKKKRMEHELWLDWLDEQEQMRIQEAYSDAEGHSTSTGEEWEVDSDGIEYIPF